VFFISEENGWTTPVLSFQKVIIIKEKNRNEVSSRIYLFQLDNFRLFFVFIIIKFPKEYYDICGWKENESLLCRNAIIT
jgi:hypothetical protein